MKRIIVYFFAILVVLSACSSNSTKSEDANMKEEVADEDILNEPEENTEANKPKIVGGNDVIKKEKVIEAGGILGKYERILIDSLDMEAISMLSDSDKKKLIGGLEELSDKHNKVLVNVENSLKDAGIDVDIDQTTGKIVMDSNILFAVDSYEVSESGKKYLDNFFRAYSSAILDRSTVSYVSQIQVIGHTDTSGTHEYNEKLSEKRAKSVMQYCLNSDNNGLNKEQRSKMEEMMIALGKSFDEAIKNADGSVDMEASRRVEFKFIMDTSLFLSQ